MPITRPCLGCGTLIPSQRSRCPQCQPAKAKTAARGYGSQWQATAKRVIARHPWCVQCGSTANLTADHIIPRARGGSDHESNLQVLCRPCNSAKRDR